MPRTLGWLALLTAFLAVHAVIAYGLPACDSLREGQFQCEPLVRDPDTGEIRGCSSDGQVQQLCIAYEGVQCTGPETFSRTFPCRPVGTHRYASAVAAQLFGGMFGAGRFYLGYPVIGVFQLFTPRPIRGLVYGGPYPDSIWATRACRWFCICLHTF